jgi:hypothetical protein
MPSSANWRDEDVKTSDLQSNLIAALLVAVKAFPAITKTKEGQAGNRKFKYAPLEEIKGCATRSFGRTG